MGIGWRFSFVGPVLVGMLLLTGCGGSDRAAEPARSVALGVEQESLDTAEATAAPSEPDDIDAPVSTEEPAETSAETVTTPVASEPAASDQAEVDTEVAEALAPEATPLPSPVPVPAGAAQRCVRLTDFTIGATNQSWFAVNDGVMGGRSSGGPTFNESVMVFDGEINTNGGGFSSVRVELGANTLTGFGELHVRARTDGRTYKLILEDRLESRDRRVSQQSAILFAPTTTWQTAHVSFANLEPRIFGRAVQSDPFRPDLASQLGIMISDGLDGPFRIEIDWIDVCA